MQKCGLCFHCVLCLSQKGMVISMKELTALQMTEFWESYNEIENIMGKITNLVILRKFDHIMDTFWCKKAPDPSLGFNNGLYRGYEAISGYIAAIKERDAVSAKTAQKLHPVELGSFTAGELAGVGGVDVLSFTTPVIEIAGDGGTAKGIWYLMGGSADFYTEKGPYAANHWGRAAVDFVREDGIWKIWHMLFAIDIDSPMGGSWAHNECTPEAPEYAEIAAVSLPEPNVSGALYETYHPRRPNGAFPRIPERYGTFTETFSYGA